MKYIYIVTRIIKGTEQYGLSIPNLGVHTSYNRAYEHYKSVVADREKRHIVKWDRFTNADLFGYERSIVTNEACCDLGYCVTEYIRLEQWKVINGRLYVPLVMVHAELTNKQRVPYTLNKKRETRVLILSARCF